MGCWICPVSAVRHEACFAASMLPRRHSHFIFAVIQSGLTCFIAAAIASWPFFAEGSFTRHWLSSWLLAWLTMLPVVLLAAPLIRAVVHRMTRDDAAS